MLIEYIERKIDEKLRSMKAPEDIRKQTIMTIEKIKQTIIEYGLIQIEKELGV